MNKVVYPNINCANVFDTCLLSVSNNNQAYINKLQGIAGIVAQEWKFFDAHCAPKTFHLFKPCVARMPFQVIAGNVTKKDLKEQPIFLLIV